MRRISISLATATMIILVTSCCPKTMKMVKIVKVCPQKPKKKIKKKESIYLKKLMRMKKSASTYNDYHAIRAFVTILQDHWEFMAFAIEGMLRTAITHEEYAGIHSRKLELKYRKIVLEKMLATARTYDQYDMTYVWTPSSLVLIKKDALKGMLRTAVSEIQLLEVKTYSGESPIRKEVEKRLKQLRAKNN